MSGCLCRKPSQKLMLYCTKSWAVPNFLQKDSLKSQSLRPADVQMHLIFLHCASLHFPRYSFFFFSYRLNICGNAASSKSVGTIFPVASLHFTSLWHILVILAVFQTLSFLYLLWWFVIRWVIVNVTLAIVLGHHEAVPHKMVNLIPKCCVCSDLYQPPGPFPQGRARVAAAQKTN